MTFKYRVDFVKHLLDLEVNNDESDENMRPTTRVPAIIDNSLYNIHEFFNRVKSDIDKSDNDNKSQNEQNENTNQGTRQSKRIIIEWKHRYTNKCQLYAWNLEGVFQFSNTYAIDKNEVRRKNRKNKLAYTNYENIHMHPEVMKNEPANFHDNWIVVPCPEGQRTILVSHKGKTALYSEKGVQLACFRSYLPGGGGEIRLKNDSDNKILNDDFPRNSVLDCIWLENDRKIYILDVLFWRSESLYHYAAQRRFLFLNYQLEQNYGLLRRIVKDHNDYSIIQLPFQRQPTSKDISGFFKEITEFKIDKLLFYYRDSLYLKGSTPLVLFLKPFMLKEVLGIEVPEQYNEKPEGYINFKRYQGELDKNDYTNNKVKQHKNKLRNKKRKYVKKN